MTFSTLSAEYCFSRRSLHRLSTSDTSASERITTCERLEGYLDIFVVYEDWEMFGGGADKTQRELAGGARRGRVMREEKHDVHRGVMMEGLGRKTGR